MTSKWRKCQKDKNLVSCLRYWTHEKGCASGTLLRDRRSHRSAEQYRVWVRSDPRSLQKSSRPAFVAAAGASSRRRRVACQDAIYGARSFVEAAWHHRQPYRNPGPTMRARWAKVDPALKARGHAGNRRLHQQWCRFNERKKPHVVANVAIARELAGWCWSLATLN